MAKRNKKENTHVLTAPNGVEIVAYNIRMSIIEGEEGEGYIFQHKKFLGNMDFDPDEPIASEERFERGIYFMNMGMTADTVRLMHLLLGELMKKEGIEKL